MTDKRIPIILHTDIGSDIDDTWALAMLLIQPQLKPLMVITDTGNVRYRSTICTKLLQNAGRTEVEVCSGLHGYTPNYIERQNAWIGDAKPEDYAGKYSEDGISRLIDLIMSSEETITLVSIGPCPTLAEALYREPRIAPRTRFVGMFGSVYKKYNNEPGITAEYNVIRELAPAKKLFSAPWKEAIITPLDTCGLVRLTGENYRKVANSSNPLTRDVIANYHTWLASNPNFKGTPADTEASSVLFDTVAIHLASSTQFLKMQKLNLVVNDQGFTVIDNEQGMPFNVAIDWEDLEAYESFLTNIYL